MSVESANRFLSRAAQDQNIRESFKAVTSPEDFLQTSQNLGYCFSAAELAETIAIHSQGALYRRSTGVWRWLREINWKPQAENYCLRAEN